MRLEEKALFGLPIETPFGDFKPMSVKDYLECAHFLQAMSFDKKRVLHELRLSYPKDKQDSKELTALLQKLNEELTMKQMLVTIMPPYVDAYISVLARCKVFDEKEFKEDEEKSLEEQKLEKTLQIVQNLTDEEFDEMRSILLGINSQAEQSAFLDPEIQRGKERGIKFNSNADSESPDPSTMVTSVVTYTGIDFKEVVDWNITQLQHMFQRVAKFQQYQAYIVLVTVAGDKIDPANWAENIKTENDSNSSDSFAVEYESFAKDLDNKLS